MRTRYRVRLGGSPPDSGDVVIGRRAAEARARRMAREVCREAGEYAEARTVEVWGGPDDECGWGACPADDSGAYYPQITVED